MKVSHANHILTAAGLSLFLCASAWSQGFKYPPEMPGSEIEVYRTIGELRLKIYLFRPEGQRQSEARPAVVFFFGGGWTNGSPAQFLNHCRRLASRGMIAAAADYRVASRNQSTILQSVQDAKSAVRWLRTHAARLGVNPDRIAAGGGSAGGHLAACTGRFASLHRPPKPDDRPGQIPKMTSACGDSHTLPSLAMRARASHGHTAACGILHQMAVAARGFCVCSKISCGSSDESQ